MTNGLYKSFSEIELNFKSVQIDFNNDKWRENIPSKPGWYYITTNAPIEELKSVGDHKYKAHINIRETINNNANLIKLGFAIIQSECLYVVYNGEAKNLKARAKEHICGHEKTFCLGLTNYPILREYSWLFNYASESTCSSINSEDKATRVLFEQLWRAKNGWPILCKK
jgi:hypothetical protein